MDFDGLYRRLYPSLFRYLQRLTGDQDAAEDIAQDAFTRLLKQNLPEEEVRPWLFTVAMNLVRDRARKSERRQRLINWAALARPVRLPDADIEREESIARVRAALSKLPERDQKLLLMREEGFRYGEIAKVVGVAPASVGTLIARAIKRFVEAYNERGTAGDEPR